MTAAPKLEPTLHVAAQRLMDLARRIEKASSEAEENRLCDERDKLLALFRAVDSAAPSAGLRETLEAAKRIVDIDKVPFQERDLLGDARDVAEYVLTLSKEGGEVALPHQTIARDE